MGLIKHSVSVWVSSEMQALILYSFCKKSGISASPAFGTWQHTISYFWEEGRFDSPSRKWPPDGGTRCRRSGRWRSRWFARVLQVKPVSSSLLDQFYNVWTGGTTSFQLCLLLFQNGFQRPAFHWQGRYCLHTSAPLAVHYLLLSRSVSRFTPGPGALLEWAHRGCEVTDEWHWRV